jgi:ATP-binding cassette subfamily E protein 1
VATPTEEEQKMEADAADTRKNSPPVVSWDASSLVLGGGAFRLGLEAGEARECEVVLCAGPNGTGKSSAIKLLAGLLKAESKSKEDPNDQSDDATFTKQPITVSYKPQMLAPKYKGTVRQLFNDKISGALGNFQFQSDVLRPMCMEELMDQAVLELSGGQLQRVAIVLTLGKPAQVYLLDEPSSYLDSSQRLIVARVIKRFVMHARKTAFIIDHDLLMSTYLADRVMVFSGQPGVACSASAPQPLVTGMNAFLRNLGVTFRRDPTNHRPRINKLHSVKDREQKAAGTYFYVGDESGSSSFSSHA